MAITVVKGIAIGGALTKAAGRQARFKMIQTSITLTGTYATGGFDIDMKPEMNKMNMAIIHERTSGLLAKPVAYSGAACTVKIYCNLSTAATDLAFVEVANGTSLSGITLDCLFFGE